jgi:uncharacterized protein YbjT (DUF2867 family)
MNGLTSEKPILVLGGTGKTGRRVARQLAERGRTARVASRSGAHHFDWHDKDTWASAVDGVGAVYVVDEQSDRSAELLAEFAALGVRQGVDRFVLLSARLMDLWVDDESMFGAERAVQHSGVGWTILRPAWFSQNFSEDPILSVDIDEGEVVLPDWTGTEPFIDAEDIAAVAVAALTEKGHDGEIYPISGPRLMTFGDCVQEIAEGSGREIRQVRASPQEYVAHLSRRGYPEGFADFMNRIFDAIRAGECAYLSDGVQRVLGREPRDFAQYVAETNWSTKR